MNDRMRGDERLAYMELNVLYDTLKRSLGPLDKRLEGDKFALRRLRTAKTLIGKVLEKVKGTIDPVEYQYLAKNSKGHEYVIRPKRVVPDESWLYVKGSDVDVLGRAIVAIECSMCVKDPTEQGKCALRKAMQNMYSEPKSPFGCGYRGGNFIDRG